MLQHLDSLHIPLALRQRLCEELRQLPSGKIDDSSQLVQFLRAMDVQSSEDGNSGDEQTPADLLDARVDVGMSGNCSRTAAVEVYNRIADRTRNARECGRRRSRPPGLLDHTTGVLQLPVELAQLRAGDFGVKSRAVYQRFNASPDPSPVHEAHREKSKCSPGCCRWAFSCICRCGAPASGSFQPDVSSPPRSPESASSVNVHAEGESRTPWSFFQSPLCKAECCAGFGAIGRRVNNSCRTGPLSLIGSCMRAWRVDRHSDARAAILPGLVVPDSVVSPRTGAGARLVQDAHRSLDPTI